MEEEYECNRKQICAFCGENKNVMLEFTKGYVKCKECQKTDRLKKRGYPIQKKQARMWYGNS